MLSFNYYLQTWHVRIYKNSIKIQLEYTCIVVECNCCLYSISCFRNNKTSGYLVSESFLAMKFVKMLVNQILIVYLFLFSLWKYCLYFLANFQIFNKY